jgi:uncharacterized protein YqgC (DUF456 family)
VAFVLLVIVVLLSLAGVPFGLPGTWLMVIAAMIPGRVMAGSRVGWLAIGVAAALALLAEVLEWTLAARYARKYGGSRRAGWGALVGGLLGAFAGIPIPLFGSVIGAFAGAFVGALVAEYSHAHSTAGSATHVATGALLGRVVATGMKLSIAFVIAVIVVGAAWP